jgi:tripartite-type tricarboxylate transporter receptor subunit TctC
MRRFTAVLGTVALGAAVQVPGLAQAQAWPAKPVRILVSSGPIGPSDVLARGMAQALPQVLGQSFVVENRPGAGGLIGTDAAAKAAPDGYTLLMTVSAPITLNPYFYSKLPYDPVRDFAPVALAGVINAVFVAHPSVTVNTLPELIALTKSRPDTIRYGSWGIGSFPDLYRAWLEKEQGAQFQHIPYKEISQVLGAVVTGDIQVLLNTPGLMTPLVKAGKLKVLAAIGTRRLPQFPEAPSFKELGYDLDFLGWTGAFAPAGTPRDIVSRLNKEMNQLLTEPGFVGKYMTAQSMDPRPGTPEEFGAFIRKDLETAGRLAKLAGVKPE